MLLTRCNPLLSWLASHSIPAWARSHQDASANGTAGRGPCATWVPWLGGEAGLRKSSPRGCADKGEGWPSRMRPFFLVLSPEPFIRRFQKGWKRSVSGIISVGFANPEAEVAEVGGGSTLVPWVRPPLPELPQVPLHATRGLHSATCRVSLPPRSLWKTVVQLFNS